MKKVLKLITIFFVLLIGSVTCFAATVTWNPNDKASNIVLSNNNLTASNPKYDFSSVRSTEGKSEGKWYFEVQIDSSTRLDLCMIGVASKKESVYHGASTASMQNLRTYKGDGTKFKPSSPYGEKFEIGDTIGVCLDMDNGTIEFHKNGEYFGVAYSDLKTYGEVFAYVVLLESKATANFGVNSFEYEVPEGYLPYDTSVAIDENPKLNIEASEEKVKVGQTFTVDVILQNVTDIYAEDFKINYDNSLFEYIGYEEVTEYKVYNTPQDNNGDLRFIVASLGEENAINGDKTILKLKFKAKAVGTGKVDALKARIADIEKEYDIEDDNCLEDTIIVEGVGDVNRTGEYTLLDLSIDAYYYGMNASDTDISKYDADQDLNGIIDDVDLTAIVSNMLQNANYQPNNI